MRKLAIIFIGVMLMLGISYPAGAQNASVTISWDAPSTSQDICAVAGGYQGDPCTMTQADCEAVGGQFLVGAVLIDLAGYDVMMGSSSGNYTTVNTIGLETTYVWTGLNNGTYYFNLKAFDTSGNRSCLADELVLAVTDTTPPSGCGATLRGQVN